MLAEELADVLALRGGPGFGPIMVNVSHSRRIAS
jgi:hypothetical protein